MFFQIKLTWIALESSTVFSQSFFRFSDKGFWADFLRLLNKLLDIMVNSAFLLQ